MTSELKAKLEDQISKWVTDNCGEKGWPQKGVGLDNLVERMVDGAALVFDVCYEASAYTEEQQ